ncbi:MAG: hypothetical protein GY855_14100 [candidate division Zixibacteria bacterium]|nr:hypothetical protein [candidate division Zixibacteria bacterium]
MKKLLITIIILMAFTASSPANIIDNAEFTENIADSAVMKLFNSEQNDPSNSFFIKPGKTHQANFILEQSLIKFIKSNNGNVYLQLEENAKKPLNADYFCEYIIVDLDLSYNKTQKPYPKDRKVWRKGRMLTIFRLLSADDGQVVNTDEVEILSEDFISEKDAAAFNRSGSFYLKPKVPGRSLKRFAEPLLVGTTVAAMIFLFFSNR